MGEKMKKIALAFLVFPMFAFADSVPVEVPGYVQFLMDMVVAIPVIGPVVLAALKWVVLVSAIFTGLATGLMGVAKALQGMGKLLGFVAFAEKVDALYKAVWPYLAWLSVYNVQKQK
jgi:hypothetical protein